jgi:hypothetical protein
MLRDVPASRTLRLIKANAATDKSSNVGINPELKELYGQLVEATLAMRDAARMARERPSPSIPRKVEHEHLDLLTDAIISRINEILDIEGAHERGS